MAKKGEWVRIHNVVLKASDRTARIPDDTRKCDTAEIGDVVTIKTATGREEKGTMIEVGSYYTHSYGKFVSEIIEIDNMLREEMFGGEE